MTGRAFDERIVIGHAGFCDACGIPSMSLPSAITGLPEPHDAMKAVGIPAIPSRP